MKITLILLSLYNRLNIIIITITDNLLFYHLIPTPIIKLSFTQFVFIPNINTIILMLY